MTTLDNLKKEAKRRLQALRAAGSPSATLREVQHALAREHGRESWRAMIAAVQSEAPARTSPPMVAAFLESACWDHHIHGRGDHRRADVAAQRLLAQRPTLAYDSIYTAVVCGAFEEVQRRVAASADDAGLPGGPRGWTPLLYLCYTRFTDRRTLESAVAIGRLLLDNGADPNDFYMAGDAPYTALVGAAGEGEQESPRQPWGPALFDLLLERGAHPFDQQVLYNTHFSGDVLWWLELVWAHTKDTEAAAAWRDPEWRMLDMGAYGTGARFLLDLAEKKHDGRLREWLLAHGANPITKAKVPVNRPASDRSPLDALFAAAARNDVEAVRQLLDSGVSIEIEDDTRRRPLHVAAGANAVNVARLLLERGAEVDPLEVRFHAPPIGFAGHHNHVDMMDVLAPRSSAIFVLCHNGYVDRVHELLAQSAALAKSMWQNESLLFWLPDDDDQALALVDLLLANGADPCLRGPLGRSAADAAERRGLAKTAARLRAAEGHQPRPARTQLDTLDGLAHDLVQAYDSGYEPALQRLRAHFGGSFTWDELRAIVQERLNGIPKHERPQDGMYEGYVALAQARLLLARAAGFESWASLASSCARRDSQAP